MSQSSQITITIDREVAAELESLMDQAIMEEAENVVPDPQRLTWMQKVQKDLATQLRPKSKS